MMIAFVAGLGLGSIAGFLIGFVIAVLQITQTTPDVAVGVKHHETSSRT